MSPPASPSHTDASADARRVVEAMEAWRRRSRLIRFFRRALPIAIGVVTLSLFGWVGLRTLLATGFDLTTRGATVRMTNPHFYGQDGQGRSFVLAAKEAVHRGLPNSGSVTLTQPLLRLTTGPDRTMEISAAEGGYDQKTRRARLTGGVRISDTGSGFNLETGEARIDTRTGLVVGNSPVRGRGPLGEISASSYAIEGKGSRVVFSGKVHTRFVRKGRQERAGDGR